MLLMVVVLLQLEFFMSAAGIQLTSNILVLQKVSSAAIGAATKTRYYIKLFVLHFVIIRWSGQTVILTAATIRSSTLLLLFCCFPWIQLLKLTKKLHVAVAAAVVVIWQLMMWGHRIASPTLTSCVQIFSDNYRRTVVIMMRVQVVAG